MVQISSSENKRLEQICKQVMSLPEIRFCGVINKLGNLIAGGFKESIEPLEKDDKRRMLYMQMILDINMRKEHDEYLGPIEYAATKRGKVLMICVPMLENTILISANPKADAHQISKLVSHLFNPCSKAITA